MTEPSLSENQDWRDLVPGPTTSDASPVAAWVISGYGDGWLLTGTATGGPALRLRASAGRPARVVVDYGSELSGQPWLRIGHTDLGDADASLLAGYSETLIHLTPTGDLHDVGPRLHGNINRYEHYPLSPAQHHVQRFMQAGFRYQMLTFDAPGEVTIDNLGVHCTGLLGALDRYDGYFLCSDPTLSRIWYACAHTVHLAMAPAGEDPGYWRSENGALDMRDTWTGPDATSLGLLRHDPSSGRVQVEMDLQLLRGSAQVAVRARPSGSGIVVRIDNTSVEVQLWTGVYEDQCRSLTTLIRTDQVDADGWIRIQLRLDDTSLWINLDGVPLGAVDLTRLTDSERAMVVSGTVGLGAPAYSAARVRNLRVTLGSEIVHLTLDKPQELEHFDRPGITERPLLLDGIKRDRLVWQGDNVVTARTLYVISRRLEYARESLRLLGSGQLPNGYIPANANPAARLDRANPDDTRPTRQYPSASYSLYYVINLSDYVRYSGDLDFLREQWPTLRRELEWNRSRIGPDDLLRTGASDGMNWRYATVTGTPGYENALYLAALHRAADLAEQIDENHDRAEYLSLLSTGRAAFTTLLNTRSGAVEFSIEQTGNLTLDATTTALLYGIITGTDSDRSIDLLLRDLHTPLGLASVDEAAPDGQFRFIGLMMLSQLLWVLADHGRIDDALAIIRQTWAPMVDGDPGMTVWELLALDGTTITPGINSGGGGNTSRAHPWSSGPAVLCSEHILGVTPTSPGYQTWQVAPQLADISWARGVVPTPHGSIAVSWIKNASQLSLTVVAPPRTHGRIILPPWNGSTAAVWTRSRNADSARPDSGWLRVNPFHPLEVQGGVESHHFRLDLP